MTCAREKKMVSQTYLCSKKERNKTMFSIKVVVLGVVISYMIALLMKLTMMGIQAFRKNGKEEKEA